MKSSLNSSAFNQNVMESTWTGLINKPGFPVSPVQGKIAAEFYNKYALPPNSSGAAVSNYAKEVYANGLQGADFANQIVPGNPVLSPPTSASPIAPTPSPPAGWTFITAPEDVSWDIANNANRVDIFGTNNPPVVAGSRGMRDLTLSNSLVEGFMRGVTIEGKVAALENLMNYSLNSSDGFVSVPVYQVWAQEKQYGGAQGYFIIKDVKVKETMRDTAGQATRAYVDISLMQVPAYQVNSGRDLASKTTAGVRAGLLQTITDQANQQMQGKGGAKPGTATSKPASGPEAGGGATTAKRPPGNQGRRGDRAGDAAEPFQRLDQPLF